MLVCGLTCMMSMLDTDGSSLQLQSKGGLQRGSCGRLPYRDGWKLVVACW